MHSKPYQSQQHSKIWQMMFHRLPVLLILGVLVITAVSPLSAASINTVKSTNLTAPEVLTLHPADDSTNVPISSDTSIVFNETVVLGEGDAQLRRLSDDYTVTSLNVANTNRVTLSTTNVANDTLNIDWEVELYKLSDYYVYISPGAVTDDSENANPFAGIEDNTTWNFTTGDFREPLITMLTPPDNATNVDPATTLTVRLDETVQAGTGNITLYSGKEIIALNETFDDTSQFTGETDFFGTNGINVFFGINFGNGNGTGIWGPGSDPSITTPYTGFDGSYLDSADSGQAATLSANPQGLDTPSVLLWDDIDVTGLSNLSFSGEFASTNDLETNDYIKIEVDINNSGSFTELIDIRGDGNLTAREDLDGDNVGDGVSLSTNARKFYATIAGTGTTLDLRMTTRTTSGGDRFAADNFIVSGIQSQVQVDQVAIGDASVTISGDTVTYTPTVTLNEATKHFVVIDHGALTDTSENENVFNDLTASSAWNFTTDGDMGSLTIVKEAAVEDGMDFAFSSNIPGGSSFSLDVEPSQTDAISESITFADIPVGSYDITEIVPSGWGIRYANCSGGVDTGTLDGDTLTVALAKNENITCTFNNSINTNIIINKDVIGDGTDEDIEFEFFFNSSNPDYTGTFYLSETESNSPSRTDGVFENLPSPIFFIVEEKSLPVNWALQDIECTADNDDVSITKFIDSNRIEFRTLASGGDIECTFINAEVGSLTIVKEATPEDGTDFTFNSDIPGGSSFVLDDELSQTDVISQSITFADIPVGSYAITETVPDLWQLDSVSCSGGSDSGTLDNETLTVALGAGEDVICTFNNSEKPYIDLTVSQTDDSNGLATVGSPFTWIITLTNNGTADAVFTNGQVIFSDALPDGPTYPIYPSITNVENMDGIIDCEISDSLLRCLAGPSLIFEPDGHLDLVMRITPTTADDLVNPSGGICAIDPDNHIAELDENNNSCSDTIVVTGADLSLTKTANADTAVAGGSLIYTVTVNNAGPDTAENVVVTDVLPDGVTLVATDGCSEDPNGVDSCSLGNIASGGSAQYSIEVAVSAGSGEVISNTATVEADTGDPNLDNNTATEETTVVASIGTLTVIKQVINDNGGTAVSSDFTMHVFGKNVSPNSFPGDENGTVVTLNPGIYDVTETGLTGYVGSFSADCSGTIKAGESKTCIVTNDDANMTVYQPFVTVDEGDTAVNSGTINDSSSGIALFASIGTVINHNDGTWSYTFDTADGPADSQTVTVTAEADGFLVSQTTFDLVVNNVAPTIVSVVAPLDPVEIDTETAIAVDFSDPAGTADETYSCTFDYENDGSIDETISGVTGTSCEGTHSYTETGVYTVAVTVTDKDGAVAAAEYQFIVVFDPYGGYVTGSGRIDSPAGAYYPDPTLTGQAVFGFFSEYRHGAPIPTGQTEFRYHAGYLNFQSVAYEWLVVQNHKAIFKGTGTINGSGNYGFFISAVDADLTDTTSVDLFRIRIWDKDNGGVVVYDNQIVCSDISEDADPCATIAGGAIAIHQSRAR